MKKNHSGNSYVHNHFLKGRDLDMEDRDRAESKSNLMIYQ